MLFLIFSLDDDRYALEANEILEVLPVPALKSLPGTPAWVAGLASDAVGTYPVIDLSALALSRPARRVMSTRLVLLAYPVPGAGARVDGDGEASGTVSSDAAAAVAVAVAEAGTEASAAAEVTTRRLGVIVERATSTLRANAEAFEEVGIETPEACYLGPVMRGPDGVIQRIGIADLLPPWVRERLFTEAA